MNENLQIKSHEDYFKFSIWYPYLQLISVITHLIERKQSRSTLDLFKLLNSGSIDTNLFKEVYTLYQVALSSTEDEFFQELKLYMKLRKTNPRFSKSNAAVRTFATKMYKLENYSADCRYSTYNNLFGGAFFQRY